MTTKRSAIGYVRVSTEAQATKGVSLSEQRSRIQAYCDAHDYQLIRIEADEGLSGKRADNRPGLKAALQSVCACKGVLVVMRLDRLARSTRDAIKISHDIDDCGADLASITEKIDTASAMGRFVFRLMASLGELEREQISERTTSTMADARKKGRRISRTPYGFDLHDDGVQLIENPSESRTIERMRALRDSGMGYHTIARTLTGEGHKPKRAQAWSAAACHRILNRVV